MGYAVHAIWTAKPGSEDLVREVLTTLAPLTREEPGCQSYTVCVDPERPGTFHLFEVYDDEQAFAAHAASPHFAEHALGRGIPALAGREREFWTTLDV